MNWRLVVMATMVLAAALLSVWWTGSKPPPVAGPAQTAMPSVPGPEAAGQAADDGVGPNVAGAVGDSDPPSRAATQPAASSIAPTARLRNDHGYEPHEFGLNRMRIYESFQRSVEDWTPDTYHDKAAERERLTGREAYEVYVYLRSCLGQPESYEQVERRLNRLERIASAEPERVDDVLRQIDQLTVGLERCEGVGIDDTGIPLMHDWLALSADLGFAQAQLAYHLSARWILSMQPNYLFREPQLALDYSVRSSDYLRAALLSGHPDALLEYARAIDDGIVFDRDPIAAYAYAFAAQQGGGGMQGETRSFIERLEPELTAGELRDAREHGRSLCERFCRL